jgi:hypothetical protein
MDDPLLSVVADYLAGRRSIDDAARDLRTIYHETGWQFNISGDVDRDSEMFRLLTSLHDRWCELVSANEPDAGQPSPNIRGLR